MYQEWIGLSVNQVFDYTCRTKGGDDALIGADPKLTYADWQRRVFQLSQGLRKLGIGRGTRVAHLMDNSVEWAQLFFALSRLGAITVPLNITWVGRELVQSMELTDAEVLVTVEEFRSHRYLDMLAEALPGLASAEPGRLDLPELPHLKRVITLSREGKPYPFADAFGEVMASGADYRAEEMLAIGDAVEPEDDCLYLPTSGSTGFPKPVVHTHASFLANCSNYADALEFSAADRLLNYGPTYHVSGLLLLTMPCLRGGAVYQLNWFEPETAMRVIEKERITVVWGFDIHYLSMRRHPRYAAYDLSSLERTVIGSNPGSFDEIASMGLPHQGNVYGCSEYLADFFPYRDRFDVARMRASHGRPMASVEQKIVDPATGGRVGPGVLGEICVKGPGLFTGYYKMPELTAQAMDDEGYFHTGDFGRMDEKGYLYYRGRLKDTVKSGGENVSAREVEIFLESETPWIATASVFGVPDRTWGEAVTAMVELRPGAQTSESEVRAFCRGRLAAYKIPKRVVFVQRGDWAVTPTGKLDKPAMRELALKQLGLETADPAAEPTTDGGIAPEGQV